MKFIATADWQLGKATNYFTDQTRHRYFDDRFAALTTLIDHARTHDASFIVVAGDVFESNQLESGVILRTFEELKQSPVPIILLPGNHDHLGTGSIYDSDEFCAYQPDIVHVLRSSEPWRGIDGVEIIGAPWVTKHPDGDPAVAAYESLEPPPAGVTRILVAHGGVASVSGGFSDLLIDTDQLEMALDAGVLHFVVLGDRHSMTEIHPRIWFPGTPMVTARRETDPNHVLLVDLDDSCRVTPLVTSDWQFNVIEYTLNGDDDISSFDTLLDSIQTKHKHAVWLKLSGTLTVSQNADLADLLDRYREVFAHLDFWDRHTDLVVTADGEDFSRAHFSTYIRDAVDELSVRAAGDDEDALDARMALTLLHRFAKGRS